MISQPPVAMRPREGGYLIGAKAVRAYDALRSVLYAAYSDEWGTKSWRRFAVTLDAADRDGYLVDQLVYEQNVTAMLAAMSGPGEEALIRFLCVKARDKNGHPVNYNAKMRLYTVPNFLAADSYDRHHVKHPSGRARANEPDLVVAIVTAGSNDTELIKPCVFVEVKGPATPSFGYGYCNNDSPMLLYRTQMDCYPEGCWLTPKTPQAAADFQDSAWVWIGPEKYATHEAGPWGKVPDPKDATDLPDVAAMLAKAKARWSPATLPELAAALRTVRVDPHGGKVPVATSRTKVEHRTPKVAAAGYAAAAAVIETWHAHIPSEP